MIAPHARTWLLLSLVGLTLTFGEASAQQAPPPADQNPYLKGSEGTEGTVAHQRLDRQLTRFAEPRIAYRQCFGNSRTLKQRPDTPRNCGA